MWEGCSTKAIDLCANLKGVYAGERKTKIDGILLAIRTGGLGAKVLLRKRRMIWSIIREGKPFLVSDFLVNSSCV